MKDFLENRIKEIDEEIKNYTKNPVHVTATGLLVEKAKPKYYLLVGQKLAYETSLIVLNKSNQKEK